jgi:uncharacterized protein (TIGR02145 family)
MKNAIKSLQKCISASTAFQKLTRTSPLAMLFFNFAFRLLTSYFLLFTSNFAFAQTSIPQVVSFSAVVRDANNQLLANTPVSLRLTFRKGGQTGPEVYCALHQGLTNANGFVSIQLNRNVLGTACNGAPATTFENIPWQEGGFWMEVEYQTVPSTPFVSLGLLELASSFYAFAAGTAEQVKGVQLQGAQNGQVLAYNQSSGKWEPTAATAGPGLPIGTTPGEMMYWNGTAWVTVNPGQQGQPLVFCNGVPTWGWCLPTISTASVASISTFAASCGGNITNDGGSAVTARGVCWSTSPDPTIALSTKTSDGTGSGSFSSSLTGLAPNTLYYVRAYATNSAGTAYGNQVSFTSSNSLFTNGGGVTDIDGNFYNSIIINGQEWMKENLKVSKYRNGNPIPTNLSNSSWQNTTSGAYAIYNNDAANNTTYGKLYNWYAVADPRGLCPAGWHVPSDAEWTTLETFLGGVGVAGGKMKSTGTIQAGTGLWYSPNQDATNSSGFTALPGGYGIFDGTFGAIGSFGYWWSSTEYSSTNAWDRNLFYDDGYSSRGNDYKQSGFSVRCLRD